MSSGVILEQQKGEHEDLWGFRPQLAEAHWRRRQPNPDTTVQRAVAGATGRKAEKYTLENLC